MPKFDANLSMLFTELDFLDRFAAAARAGFRGVEYLSPYAYPEREVSQRLREAGLEQVLFNLPSGDWDAGERGIACLPNRVDEFRAGVAKAVSYANALGCKRINCLAGIAPPGAKDAELRRTLVENLRYAAKALEDAGVLLVLEPVNTYDIPGFFVHHTRDGLAIIDEVGSSNLKLQYDVYHMQRMEGELANTMQANLARIGHIQLADNPGRHEPGTGEINYPFLFALLDRIGYDGWIGCEYKPQGRTEDGLRWMEGYGSPVLAGAREKGS